MTSKHWMAIGVLGAGGVALLSAYLYARGRHHEAFALAVSSTITSTVFAAARILSEDEVKTVYPSDLDVGPATVISS